jgi:hypothetical protein
MMSPDSEMWPLAVLFVCLLLTLFSVFLGHPFIAVAFGFLGIAALFVEW